VRQRVAHAADDDAAAEVRHLRADAQQAAHAGNRLSAATTSGAVRAGASQRTPWSVRV
jgi:type II secretory pathway component PulM